MPNYGVFTNEKSVCISDGACIGSHNILRNSIIKQSTIISSYITDSCIGDNCVVRYGTLEESNVGDGVSIGVYAHLRKGSHIHNNVKLGNFVETKNCEIGDNTKVSHLTYVGDATLGNNINVGCGTVFCNYDGVNKHHTNVGDGVFIGSNSNLVAPLNIEANCMIAAGSTITKDVPAKCLAIARVRQVNKDNYIN